MSEITETTEPTELARRFRPSPRYRLMAAGSGILFLFLGWSVVSDLLRGQRPSLTEMDAGLLFFWMASLGIALWYARLSLSSVETTAESLTLKTPLAPPKRVATKQMAGLSVSNRSGHVITILYHPLGRNSLIDANEIASLTLPEVDEQETLLTLLEGWMPP